MTAENIPLYAMALAAFLIGTAFASMSHRAEVEQTVITQEEASHVE